MKITALSAAILGTATLAAASSFGPLNPSAVPYEREYIWPEGRMPNPQPHQIAATTEEVASPGFKTNDFRRPYIEWFKPNEACKTDLCVIFLSGGGFIRCCDNVRLQPAVDRFVRAGVTVVNLTYRTPRPIGLPIHQSALEDAQRAVRVVRSQAARRGFSPDKIGATGMSAGGKLLLLLATRSLAPAYEPIDEIDKLPSSICFAVPQAPAYVLSDSVDTVDNRDGDGPDIVFNPELHFDAATCPMCFIHGGIDNCSPLASTQVYRQLHRMGLPGEVHIFADTKHAFHGDMNKGDDATAADHWFYRVAEFVRQMNYDGRLGGEVDVASRFPDDSARERCERQDIWPEGKMPYAQAHQCTPYIEWHFPKERKTKSVQIIFSGDGYMDNDPDGVDVVPARRFLNAKGMTVVTLKYRVPRPVDGLGKHVSAWQDLQRTIRIVRSQAAKRGLDPKKIGVMGSSAGGHLALMAATSSRHKAYLPVDRIDWHPCTVQWAVALCPTGLLEGDADNVAARPADKGFDCTSARFAREFSFDVDTCPVLFLHGDADDEASVFGSVVFWEQMRRMGVQGEMHTFVKSPHHLKRRCAPDTGS